MIKLIVVVAMLLTASVACADSWENLVHDLNKMGITDIGPRPTEDPPVIRIETDDSNYDYGTCQSSLTDD